MKFSFCLFFCSMLFGCTTQPADKNENRILPEFNDQTPTEEINVNSAYPFGSTKLDSIKYPHHWDEDHENYGHLKSPEGKEVEDISTLLSGLHNAPTITGPKVDSIEFLNLNEQYKADSFYFDTLAVKSLDSCLYRLPDFGKYECYYYRQHSKKMTYGVYGSLLLLDSTTRIGKLLTLYFEYGGDQHVNLRYYLIDKNTIKLYDGSCYDDGTTLRISFEIVVDDDREIEVRKIER